MALQGGQAPTSDRTVATFVSSNYQPYGPTYGESGIEEFMYTGKMLDELTNLYYFGARFYDEATGRFITEDSNTGTQDDPMSLLAVLSIHVCFSTQLP